MSAVLPITLGQPLAAAAGTRTYAIPPQDGALIDKDAQLILVRWQNRVYVFALSCPHQRNALRWQARDQRFQCPKHKSRYRPDGTFISGRATRGMDRYPLRRDQDNVMVDTMQLIKQDENRAAWEAAFIQLD